MRKFILLVIVFVLVGAISGCAGDRGGPSSVPAKPNVLLYNGAGASSADVAAIAGILDQHGVEFTYANENDLNKMSVEDLENYGTIAWPGGYAGTATTAVSPTARMNIRKAVMSGGVNYVGFCAGAFFAMNKPGSSDKEAPEYGVALLNYDDPVLPEYKPDGIIRDDQPETQSFTLSTGKEQKMVWWGGPYFPKSDQVIAKYADGTPAMIQGQSGQGYVVLSGPHPESPSAWVDHSTDTDGPEIDRALAWQLIDAARTRTPLPTF